MWMQRKLKQCVLSYSWSGRGHVLLCQVMSLADSNQLRLGPWEWVISPNDMRIDAAENRRHNMHINKQNLLWEITEGSMPRLEKLEREHIFLSQVSWRDAKPHAQVEAVGFGEATQVCCCRADQPDTLPGDFPGQRTGRHHLPCPLAYTGSLCASSHQQAVW